MEKLLDCGHEPSPHSEYTTGTAHTTDGREVCWDCAAILELADMNKFGRASLYLVKRDDGLHITNWTGKLDYKVTSSKTSRHNLGGTRTDVWFKSGGQNWHGYQIGNFSQIAHCRRIKSV